MAAVTLPTDSEYRLGVWKIRLADEVAERFGYFEHTVEGAKYAHELLDAAEAAFIEERYAHEPEIEPDLEAHFPGLARHLEAGTAFQVEASTNEYRTASGGQAYFVTVGTLDRVYLGPEEGGRWGDVVEPVAFYMVESEADAWALRETLYGHSGGTADEAHPDFGRYPDTGRSSSVLGGEDYAIRIGVRPAEPDYPIREYS